MPERLQIKDWCDFCRFSSYDFSMTYFYKKVLAVVFLAGATLALYEYTSLNTKLVVPDSSCSCQSSVEVESLAYAYNYGPFKGKCLNHCDLRNAELQSYSSNDIMAVRQIYHRDRFWKTQLDLNQLKEFKYLFENFGQKANHTAIEVTFKKPIVLESLESNSPVREKVNTLVFSVEGAPPIEQNYNMISGVLGSYVISYRLYSKSQYVKVSKENGNSIKEFVLDMSKIRPKKFVYHFLSQSYENGFKKRYQLLLNNCATSSIDMLEAASGNKYAFDWRWESIYNVTRGLPVSETFGTMNFLKNGGFLKSDPVVTSSDPEKADESGY